VTHEHHHLEDSGKMRMGRPSDVADVVLRLCADQAIIGRGVSINAGAVFDLGDDTEGGEGYLALAERRKLWAAAAQQQQAAAKKEVTNGNGEHRTVPVVDEKTQTGVGQNGTAAVATQ
jgi:hypothetical protein